MLGGGARSELLACFPPDDRPPVSRLRSTLVSARWERSAATAAAAARLSGPAIDKSVATFTSPVRNLLALLVSIPRVPTPCAHVARAGATWHARSRDIATRSLASRLLLSSRSGTTTPRLAFFGSRARARALLHACHASPRPADNVKQPPRPDDPDVFQAPPISRDRRCRERWRRTLAASSLPFSSLHLAALLSRFKRERAAG